MNAANNLPRVLAVDTSTIPANVCGAVTFWRLDGACNAEALALALAGSGITPPSLPSHAEALKRACVEQAEKHLLVRPLPGRGGGFALVRETPNPETGSLKYADELVIKLKVEKLPDGSESVQLFRPAALETATSAALAAKVRTAYDAARMRLDSSDIGGWLVQLAKKLKAVSLRDSGGVYFIPRDAMPTWKLVTQALKVAGTAHTVAEIPSLRADEAVAAVLDALTREAEAVMNSTRDALTVDESTTPIGARAIQTRQREAEALQEKLSSYEALLGKSLEGITTKLAEMQATLGRAYLAALED